MNTAVSHVPSIDYSNKNEEVVAICNKINIVEKKSVNNGTPCQFILKRGPKKGNACGKPNCKNHDNTVKKPKQDVPKVKLKTDVKVEMSDDSHTTDLHNNASQHIENVLEICQIPASINVLKIIEMAQNYMDPRKEFYTQTESTPFIESSFSEWWVQKASEGTHIGKGSVGMDVKTGSSEGIDVMCVIMNEHMSNEKSLMQKFEGEGGVNLDSLFIEKKDKEALDLYINNYYKKLTDCVKSHDLGNMYIISFVSTKTSVSIICFKINVDLIKKVTSIGFTAEGKNILTAGFINSEYGDVRLYKSKKRMELRLKKVCISHPYTVKLLDF
jgi:hypothetical protein